ncbi:hypothetical protein D3C76_1694720 [compost metagenome]
MQLVEILRSAALVVLAQGDEQVAIAIEHQARAEVDTAGELGFLAEDHLEVFQPAGVVAQATTPDRGSGGTALTAAFGVGEIDQPVLGEGR